MKIGGGYAQVVLELVATKVTQIADSEGVSHADLALGAVPSGPTNLLLDASDQPLSRTRVCRA